MKLTWTDKGKWNVKLFGKKYERSQLSQWRKSQRTESWGRIRTWWEDTWKLVVAVAVILVAASAIAYAAVSTVGHDDLRDYKYSAGERDAREYRMPRPTTQYQRSYERFHDYN